MSLPTQQAQQRKRRDAFTAPGFSHNADDLAGAHLKMHILRPQGLLLSPDKGDVQAAHLQQRLRRCRLLHCFFSISRTAAVKEKAP